MTKEKMNDTENIVAELETAIVYIKQLIKYIEESS